MKKSTFLIVILLSFFYNISNAQCSTAPTFTVTKTNGTCSSNATISVTVATSTGCSTYYAQIEKIGGSTTVQTFPATGGTVTFTSLAPGDYNVLVSDGSSANTFVFAANPVVLTTSYTTLNFTTSSTPPTCFNTDANFVPDGKITINVTGGIGPFTYTVVSSPTGTQTVTSASRTQVISGMSNGETVNVTVTDNANYQGGCSVSTSQTPTLRSNGSQAFRHYGFRAFNYIRDGNCNARLYVNFDGNMNNITKTLLPGNATITIPAVGGTTYPLTYATGTGYRFYYDDSIPGRPPLTNGMSIKTSVTNGCITLDRTDTVVMNNDYIQTAIYTLFDQTTCTKKYRIDIFGAQDINGNRNIYFNVPNNITFEYSPTSLNGPWTPLTIGTDVIRTTTSTADNPMGVATDTPTWDQASVESKWFVNNIGNYRITASDGCHTVVRTLYLGEMDPFSRIRMTETQSVIQGTSGLRFDLPFSPFKSPMEIKLRRVDGQTNMSLTATGPTDLAGTYNYTFPITRTVTPSAGGGDIFVFTDLPLGQYVIDFTDGCSSANGASITRTVTLSNPTNYNPVFTVNRGCTNSNTLSFNLNGTNVVSDGIAYLYKDAGGGALGALVGSTPYCVACTRYTYGTFTGLSSGNYVLLYDVYNTAFANTTTNQFSAALNKFHTIKYKKLITIEPYSDITLKTTTAYCDPTSNAAGLVDVQIESGTVVYPLTYTIFSSDLSTVISSTTVTSPTTNAIFTGLAPGNYVVRGTATCSSFDKNFSIQKANTIPFATSTYSEVCPKSPITILALSASKNLYNVVWTNDQDATSFNGFELNVNPSVTTTYTATFNLKDSLGCVGSVPLQSSITVNVVPNPDVTLAVTDIDLCLNNIPTVTVSNSKTNYSYELTNSSGVSYSPPIKMNGTGGDITFNIPSTVTLTAGTTLKVKVTNVFNSGCSDFITDEVTIKNGTPSNTIDITSDPVGSFICTGKNGSITIKSAQSGVRYEILNNGSALSPPLVATGTGADITLVVPSGNLVVGDNTFTVRASASSCTTTILLKSLVIKVNNDIATSNVSTTCSANAITYTVTATINNGVAPYTASGTGSPGTWNGNVWTSNAINAGVNYNVDFKDINSCNSASITGIFPVCCSTQDLLAPTIVSLTQPTCASITGTVVFGDLTTNSTWTLINSNGTTQTGNTSTATITGLAAPGNYSFNVRNISGCTSATRTVNITSTCDSDNDGVTNLNDLDDDNDGILDNDELGVCTTTNRITNGTFPTSGSLETIPSWNVTGSFTAISRGLEFRRDNSATASITQTVQSGIKNTITLGNLYWFRTGGGTADTKLEVFYNGVLYSTIQTPICCVGAPTIVASNGASVNIHSLQTLSTSAYSTTANLTITLPIFDNAISGLVELKFTSGSNPSNANDLGLASITFNNCPDLDTDNDGIVNRLDLDSDGDGCSDAIEGGANFILTNLVNSNMPGGNNGLGFTGNSTVPVTENLGNVVGSAVTNIGVPTIAGTGQTIGTSQNVLIKDPSCCLFTVTCPTFPTTNLQCYADLPSKTTFTEAEFEALGNANGIIGNVPCGIIQITAQNSADTNTCPQVVTRTYTVTEYADTNNNGVRDTGENTILNATSCSQTITIRDTTAPVITGNLAALTIEACNGVAPTAVTTVSGLVGLNITDNCSNTFSVTATDTSANLVLDGSFENPQISTILLTPMTFWNNFNDSNKIEVWVNDPTPPADGKQFIELNGSNFGRIYQDVVIQPGKNYTFSFKHRGRILSNETVKATLSNPDDGSNSVAFTNVATLNVWKTYTNTYTASATQTKVRILFESVVSPNLASGNFLDDVRLTNNCQNVVTRVYKITDSCNNSSFATQTITIQDSAKPITTGTLTSLTVEGCNTSNAPSAVTTVAGLTSLGLTITDSCTSNFIITSVDTNSGTCPTVVTRVYSITDSCNNSATATQTITIKDTTKPTITGTLLPIEIEGCGYADVSTAVTSVSSLVGLTVTDSCTTNFVVTSVDTYTGTCPTVVTRVYTITDACNNSATATQTITIKDTTKPTITGTLLPIEIEGCGYADVSTAVTSVSSLVGLTVTDSCTTNFVVTSVDTYTGTCPTIVTRVYTITDSCNNSATATQTITIKDTTKPTITGTLLPIEIEGCSYADLSTAVTSVSSLVGLTVTDSCTTNFVVTSVDTYTGTCPTVVTRVYTITDSCNNSATATQTITIKDTTKPTITGTLLPIEIEGCSYADVSTAVTSVSSLVGLTVTDSCTTNFVVTSVDTYTGTCPTVVTRVYTITDSCNNSATATQTITIKDTTKPTITGTLLPIEIEGCSYADVSTAVTSVSSLVGLTVTDSCTTNFVVTSVDTYTGTCPTVVTRVYTITDSCNNSATATQTITIKDTTAPSIVGTLSVVTATGCTISDAPVAVSSVSGLTGLSITDNCTSNSNLVVTSIDILSGTLPIIITRVYTVKDSCNNSTVATQTILMYNSIAPTLTTTSPKCNNDGTYSIDFISNGTVTAVGAIKIEGKTITANNDITISATNGCASTIANVMKPVCPDTCISITYAIGNTVCNGSTYDVALTVSSGTSVSTTGTIVSSNGQILGIKGLSGDANITFTNGSCTKSATIIAPNCVTPPCDKPAFSLGTPVCNGTNYTVSILYASNTSVSVNGIAFTENVITSAIGNPITIVATASGCLAQSQTINPTSIGVAPTLTVTSPKCNLDGTYSFDFISNGTVTAVGATISGNTITTNKNITVTAFNGCAFTTIDVVKPVCPDTCTTITYSLGNTVCNGTGYNLAITVSSGTTIVVASPAVVESTSGVITGINGLTGNTTITLNNGTCTKTINVTAPVCPPADPCNQPAFSLGTPVCTGSSTYTVSLSLHPNAIVSIIGGTINSSNTLITGTTGVPVTVVATISGCTAQTLTIKPTSIGVAPTLTVTSPKCNLDGTYSFDFISNGTVTAVGATISGNTIITNKNVTVTAFNGCAFTTIDVTKPVCPDTCTTITYSLGNTVCNGTGYNLAITVSSGTTIVVASPAVVESTSGVITGINGLTGNTTITLNNGTCTKTINVTAPVCPPADPCNQPAFSLGTPVCTGSSTYTVSLSLHPSAIVSIIGGTINSSNTLITGTTGVPVIVLATISGCTAQSQTINPTSIGVAPTLTVTSPKCNLDGTYSFDFISNGTVTAVGATISGNTITTDKNVTVTAFNGCAFTTIDVTKPVCPNTCTTITYSIGNTLCNGTNYDLAITVSSGTTIVVASPAVVESANGVITGIKGLTGNTTITLNNGTCTKTINVTAPVCPPADPCNQPAFSLGTPVCTGSSTYTVSLSLHPSATVSIIGGTINSSNTLITGTTGVPVIVLATISGCTAQSQTINPTSIGVAPTLTVTNPVCNNTGYTFTYQTNGAVTVTGTATVNGNTVTVASLSNVTVTAFNGCAFTTANVEAPVCPETQTCTGLTYALGNTICNGSTFDLALTVSNGTTVTTSGTIIYDGVEIVGIKGLSGDTMITFTNGSCTKTVAITAPNCVTPPCDKPAFSLGTPVCNGSNYTVSIIYASNTLVKVNSVTLTGNVISVPKNNSVTIVATVSNCTSQSQTINPTNLDNIAPIISGTLSAVSVTGCSIAAAPMPANSVDSLLGLTISDNNTTNDKLIVTYKDTNTGTCPIIVTRVYTITDGCDNSSFATQTITINNINKPILNGTIATKYVEGCSYTNVPPAVTTVAGLNSLGLTITDSCTTDFVITSLDSYAGSCPTVVTRVYTITNACNNSSTATQTIIIQDTIAPIIIGDLAPINLEGCGLSLLPPAEVSTTDLVNKYNVVISDSCTTNFVISSVDSSTGTCPIIVTRVYKISDGCGNSSFVTQTISIIKPIPKITGSLITLTKQGCDLNAAPLTETSIQGLINFGLIVVDTCNTDLVITSSDSVSNTGCTINIIRTYSIADACNNNVIATPIQLITIKDTKAPIITGTLPALTVNGCSISDLPAAATTVSALGLTISDSCTTNFVISSVDNATSIGCATIVTRTYKISDTCNNSSFVTQTITIQDTTAPIISGTLPQLTVNGCSISDLPNAATSVSELGLTISDSCTNNFVITSVDSITSSACSTIVTRVYKISDTCNNSSFVTQTITIQDTTAPTISGTLPALTVSGCSIIDAPAAATTASALGLTISDSCSTNFIITSVDSITSTTCSTIVTRVYKISDACNNSSFATQTITIKDNVAPLISGIISPSIIEGCDVSIAPIAATSVSGLNTLGLTVTDSCSSNLVVTSVDSHTGICPIIVTRVYKITDSCGNSSFATHTITIQDTITPTLSGTLTPITNVFGCTITNAPQAATTIGGLQVLGVTVSDNCINNLKVISVDTYTGTCPIAVTRTYTISDSCGNSVSISQTFNITATIDAVDDLINYNFIQDYNILNDNGNGPDKLNNALTIGEVNVSIIIPATPINTGDPVPSVNTSTGAIFIPVNTPYGTYNIIYQICEKANPTNCDMATVTVVIDCYTFSYNDCDGDGNPNESDPHPKVPTAIDDYFDAQIGVTTSWNILGNDDFKPSSNISLSSIPGGTASGYFTMDPLTGTFTYVPMVYESGTTVTVNYQVCYQKDTTKPPVCATATIYIKVPKTCEIIVYNALAPDGYTGNDAFYIKGLDCYAENKVQIFNRWGVVLYEKENYNNKDDVFRGFSDGRSNVSRGDGLPEGTYYYILTYKDFDGNDFSKSGYLYINR